MKFKFLTLLTLMAFISCSSNKSVDDTKLETEQDSVGLEDENNYENDESVNEEGYSDNTIEEKSEEPTSMAQNESSGQIQINGEEELYTVEKGDTLMLIAFKLYGDCLRWKEIQQKNPELSSFESLQTGSQIKVIKPTEEFHWRPEGNPYLIKRHDTLRKISFNVYETEQHWSHLYKHNDKLIKDPNVIYAGFTIYYLDKEQLNRDPANTEMATETPVQEGSNTAAEPYQGQDTVENMATPKPVVEENVAQAVEPSAEAVENEPMAEEQDPEALEFEE